MNGMFFTMVEENSNCQPLSSAVTLNYCSLKSGGTTSNDKIKEMTRFAAFVESVNRKIITDSFILGVDEYSFKVFPVAFAMFNAFYWLGYV